MRVVKMIAEEAYVNVLTVRETYHTRSTADASSSMQCYADGGSSTRGNLPNAGVVERQSIAEKSVRALRGAKAIDSGAAQRMEMKTLKMFPIAPVVVQIAAMAAAVACDGESD